MAVRRIAMWSGPRNISTAMMRAWGNRTDTIVCDEPLYAHYLLITGKDHPGRDEVIAHHETDWRKVAATLTGPLPRGKTIFYQKHMAHHLLADVGRDWFDELIHVFLIREPREMLVSLTKTIPNPTTDDTGLPQQIELFDSVRGCTNRLPPVIDARDVLENPRKTLTLLCEALNVPFDEAMLHWPSGRRATDGVWAKHWYHAVERSTTFEPYRPKLEQVPSHLEPLLRECEPLYARLHGARLR